MSETRFCSACGKTCVSWADWVGHNCMKYSRDTIARLTAENAALREENQSLLDCLNGRSKAVYTAEMYDALRARCEAAEEKVERVTK